MSVGPSFLTSFLAESSTYLRDVFLPRLRKAVDVAEDGDFLWWRPNERTNSIGNLLLHLEGNVRQWILHGLGGAPDDRARSAEFAAKDGEDPWPALERTVRAAAGVITDYPPDRLDAPLRIQGFDTTAMRAVYHVVEHFSWHVGQAVWIAKARGGPDHGITFYDDAALE